MDRRSYLSYAYFYRQAATTRSQALTEERREGEGKVTRLMSKQSDKARVSVIIPTHNRAAWLPASLSSVLEQTYQNFEILVVDDASTDNTEEVVKNFRSRKIRYFSHESQRGAPASRSADGASLPRR